MIAIQMNTPSTLRTYSVFSQYKWGESFNKACFLRLNKRISGVQSNICIFEIHIKTHKLHLGVGDVDGAKYQNTADPEPDYPKQRQGDGQDKDKVVPPTGPPQVNPEGRAGAWAQGGVHHRLRSSFDHVDGAQKVPRKNTYFYDVLLLISKM